MVLKKSVKDTQYTLANADLSGVSALTTNSYHWRVKIANVSNNLQSKTGTFFLVGGMGSIPGAFIAALLVAELKAICIWLGVQDIAGVEISFSKLTLVVEFLVMAVVLMPPTLIASVYGMNFKMMPELEHPWGYPLALLAMLCAAVGPYLFFKWKRWL